MNGVFMDKQNINLAEEAISILFPPFRLKNEEEVINLDQGSLFLEALVDHPMAREMPLENMINSKQH